MLFGCEWMYLCCVAFLVVSQAADLKQCQGQLVEMGWGWEGSLDEIRGVSAIWAGAETSQSTTITCWTLSLDLSQDGNPVYQGNVRKLYHFEAAHYAWSLLIVFYITGKITCAAVLWFWSNMSHQTLCNWAELQEFPQNRTNEGLKLVIALQSQGFRDSKVWKGQRLKTTASK